MADLKPTGDGYRRTWLSEFHDPWMTACPICLIDTYLMLSCHPEHRPIYECAQCGYQEEVPR